MALPSGGWSESYSEDSSSSSIDAGQVIAVIPARFSSQRFPGKPLADLEGRPLIAWVVAAAGAARRVGHVLVATDHDDIASAAEEAGAEAVLTSCDHATGTDRIGEAVRERAGSVVLNVQGDEPLVDPNSIDALVDLLERDSGASVSTLACTCSFESVASPHVVKVVCDEAGRALYFSRSPIPGSHPSAAATPPAYLRHVGLYGLRREALAQFLEHAPGRLETVEGLEQLRFLEMGRHIVVGQIPRLEPGVDTPEDLENCRRIVQARRA